MASTLHKVKETIMKKAPGMSGIGVDQSALDENSEATLEGYQRKYGKPSEGFQPPGAQDNMAGIGPDQSALGNDSLPSDVTGNEKLPYDATLEGYEKKYGKPSDEATRSASEGAPGQDMLGIGVDQSALGKGLPDSATLSGYEQKYGKPDEEVVRKVSQDVE